MRSTPVLSTIWLALALAACQNPDVSTREAPKPKPKPTAPEPVVIEAPEVQRNLRSLHGLFIDAGSRDQFNAHYGARALVRRLAAHGIPHVYEEFPDDHSNTTYRLDVSLPHLYRALDGAGPG